MKYQQLKAKRISLLPRAICHLLLVSFFLLLIFGTIEPSYSQTLTLDIGEPSGSTTARILQMVALIAVLSLAPGLLVTITSFTRIVAVLSLLRTALGTQQSPPNVVMISLALFLSAFIMAPTFEQAWQEGISPLIEERIDETEAFEKTAAPFRTFMLRQVRDKDLALFEDIAQVETDATGPNALTSSNTSFYDKRTKKSL